jgi:hypothetical protein
MTSQERNEGVDLKTGSADSRVTGERAGLPGERFAGQAGADAPTATGASADASGDADPAAASRKGSRTIPEQAGCGPNVTDYPGLSDKPAH